MAHGGGASETAQCEKQQNQTKPNQTENRTFFEPNQTEAWYFVLYERARDMRANDESEYENENENEKEQKHKHTSESTMLMLLLLKLSLV